LAALAAGAHALRINPGNIGSDEQCAQVARAAAALGVAVRVGVNSGSIPDDLREKHGGPTPEALVESALRHCAVVEAAGCSQIKVSLKAADVRTTVTANRLFAERTDFPLHLGVTEAGTPGVGVVKSAVAIGALLLAGIGDTIRVSLTAPPVEEVVAGLRILRALNLRGGMPDIVSCPMCGRTEIDMLPLVEAVEQEVSRLLAEGRELPLRSIAVMGCVVNGPGEARMADIGMAGGRGKGVIFRHGEIVRRVPENQLLDALLDEIRNAAHSPPPHHSY